MLSYDGNQIGKEKLVVQLRETFFRTVERDLHNMRINNYQSIFLLLTSVLIIGNLHVIRLKIVIYGENSFVALLFPLEET